jgi:hypothetical protein
MANQPDFKCKVCGVECAVAPADNSGAICPDHCEDHDYEYERGEGHHCKHCFAEPPSDYFEDSGLWIGDA